MAMNAKRLEKIKKIQDNINKRHKSADGTMAITYLGNTEKIPFERFSAGCVELDEALGGGWPLGRIVEVYGNEAGGKTTICYHAIAEFQKKYPEELVAWCDSEYSYDPEYAEKCGVNSDEILMNQPESGEQAFNVIKDLLNEGVKLVIIDSVAALTPRAELEKDIGDRTVGEQARLMSSGLRQLVQLTGKSKAFLLFTNQTRDKIGVSYGDPSTTPGGKALKFYSSIRLQVTRIGSDKQGETVIGNRVKAVTKKNKTCAPFRTANFAITFGIGIDAISGVFDSAVDNGVISKGGAGWFTYGDDKIQGKPNFLDLLRDDEELLDKIKAELEVKIIAKKEKAEEKDAKKKEARAEKKSDVDDKPKGKRGRPARAEETEEVDEDVVEVADV